MDWTKTIARWSALLILPLLLWACTISYKLNGSSINYDKVNTITIDQSPITST